MSPQRIQLSRVKGWRKPEGAVVVARPSKWGNPIRWANYPVTQAVGDEGESVFVSAAERRRWAVIDFEAAVRFGIGYPSGYPSHDDMRRELAGKDLACWCPTGPGTHCHADVLLQIANAPEEAHR